MQKTTTTKNSAHSRIEKYIQIFVTVEEKVLSLGKFSIIATGGQGALPSILVYKNYVFGTSCKVKKTDNGAKRNNNLQS